MKNQTYKLKKPDGTYHYETVNVNSVVPIDVHLSCVKRSILQHWRADGEDTKRLLDLVDSDWKKV